MKLDELGAAIKAKHDEAQGIFAEIDTKQSGVGTKEQREAIKRLNQEAGEMEQSYQSLAEQEGLKSQHERRGAWLNQPERPMIYPVGSPESRGDRDALAVKTWGEVFTDSELFQKWFKSLAPSGTLHKDQKIGNSPALQFPAGLKALLTGTTTWSARADTNAGALVQLDQRGLLEGGTYRRPLRIADLIPRSPTTGDTIEYVRVTGFTNNAAPVAEATATSGSSGAKPESGHTFEVIHDRVRTIAHWEPITRRALADAGQVRGLIDEDLRYGLDEELEDQIIGGSGTGENFTGILNVSGTLTQAYTTDLLTTTRKAITNLTLNGREMATGWVMHPSDWETFDLLKDNEGQYYWGGPGAMGPPRLWSQPVILSEGMTVGTAVLGNWRRARLWDREETNIYVSDSHADFFIRNLLAILAEMRLGFGIVKPKAFVEVDLTA